MTERLPATADVRQHLAVIYNKIGDARRLRAAAGGARILPQEPCDHREAGSGRARQHAVASASRLLLEQHRRAGDRRGSLARLSRALTIRAKLAASDAGNATWQRDLCGELEQRRRRVDAAGKVEEALASYRQSLAIIEKLAATDPGNPQWLRFLTIGENKSGDILADAGKWDEALEAYRKGLAIRQRLAAADPGNADRQYDLAFSHGRVAHALVGMKQFEEALASFSPSRRNP